MIEPVLALQTAIRQRLISLPAITDLVPADQIIAGTTRPDKARTIIIADGQTEFHGLEYTGQRLARVFLDVHVWSFEEGPDCAKTIGFAVRNALDKAPPISDCSIDDFALTRSVWMRDPDPAYGHGVLSVEAIMRWGGNVDYPVTPAPPASDHCDGDDLPDLTLLFENKLI